MLNRLSSETLLRWQQYCLFAAVLLFPLQGPPAFLKVLGPVSFFGQPSSVLVVIGLVLCAVTYCRTAEDSRGFYCALALGVLYLAFLAGLSLHAIAVFAPYDDTVFKMTSKMADAAAVLTSLGLQDEILLWKVLIFLRDMRIGVFEVVYAFGFAAWVSYLYVKSRGQAFRCAAGGHSGFLSAGAVRGAGSAASV